MVGLDRRLRYEVVFMVELEVTCDVSVCAEGLELRYRVEGSTCECSSSSRSLFTFCFSFSSGLLNDISS
jgi:hypothetical protein